MLKRLLVRDFLCPVCEVQVGHKYKFRSQPQGKNLAISIVDSHPYSNESGSCDELLHCGHQVMAGLDSRDVKCHQKIKNSKENQTLEFEQLGLYIPLCGLKPLAEKVIYLDLIPKCNGYSQKPKVTVTRKPLNNSENVCDPDSSLKTSVQSVMPRKRPLDDVYDCKVGDDKKPRTVVSNFRSPICGKDEYSFGSRPTRKAGYGEKPKVTTKVVTQNVESDFGKITSCEKEKDTPVDSKPGENNKVKRLEPKELGRNKSYLDKRPASKVKYWDRVRNWIEPTTSGSSKEVAKREKIKEAMSIFNEVYERLDKENRLKQEMEKISCWKVIEEVAKIVKRKLKWMDPEKVLGPVCGVQVGDKFKFRLQLQMIGLHCQPLSGIDYTNFEGKNLAISIVDSHRYSNESRDCDKLIYCGHGGQRVMGGTQQIEHQKLEGGNLALKNSKDEKTPVRVIRKVEDVGKNLVFMYDGLYIVSDFIRKTSEEGKIVFKFELNRIPGQPATLPNAMEPSTYPFCEPLYKRKM